MLLTQGELRELLDHLAVQLEVQEKPDGHFTWKCDETLKHTRAWLKTQQKDVRANVRAFGRRSLFCDCEILFNMTPARWRPDKEQVA